MIKAAKNKSKEIEIDLTGPQGNAFYLIGVANNLGKSMGMSKEKVNNLIKEMTSGDYENLVKVFDDAFGSFVILYR
jgi:hypothetical protein